MKFIVCTGDSHTWGQGVADVFEHFTDPTVQGGDLRPVPFFTKGYVNLVREEICRRTGSTFLEDEPKTLIEGDYRTGRKCDAARFVFRFDGHNNYKIAAVINGVSHSPLLTARTDENGELIVTPTEPMFLCRAEYYTGAYAVINAGVGSCTTRRYLEEFYHDYVELFDPFCIVAEAHSINDWLNHIPLNEVKANLTEILAGCPNAKPVLVTVQPVAGETGLPFNETGFDEYVRVSRETAEENGFALVDANRTIGSRYYSDNWHPNETGHAIYAEGILDVLTKIME